MEKQFGLETLAVHGGYTADSAEHSVVPPIYQTNAYAFESVEQAAGVFNLSQAGNIYSRITNPTVAVLEERVNLLEGGIGAVAMASGHAAIFNTILNLAGTGDEIVSSQQIYGGAVNLLGVTLANIGITTHFVPVGDFAAWQAAITPNTKAFFVEMLGNPNANVADLEKIVAIAHAQGIPVIVDSTMTTPYLFRPFAYGADIIIHSATKYLSGQGNTMAGVIVDSGKFVWKGNPRFPQYNRPDKSYHGLNFGADVGDAGFIVRLRTLLLRDVGACLSPFNAFLILTGLETLVLRMEKHCKNAQAVAEFLAEHPAVEKVHYPLLPSSEDYSLAKKYLPKGCAGVFTFELKGGRKAGAAFLDSLELLQRVANLGDARSLAIHPATTTHSQLSDEQLAASGISAGTVRLSIGIESIEDILADIEQAIAAAQQA